MATPKNGGRGSEKMQFRKKLEEHFKNGNRTITPQDASPIFDLHEPPDVRLLSFWVRGQPDPDTLGGVIHATQAKVGAVVGQLASSNKLQLKMNVTVLPYGSAEVSFCTPNMSFTGGQPSPAVVPPK
jgi:hypothetical protein